RMRWYAGSCRLARWRSESPREWCATWRGSMATVDVIIATRDRPAALRRSLAALEGQTRRDFGVIVVDDASTPPVDSWLKASEFPALDLRILSLAEHGGPARARNAGIEASTADYIAFIDDDVEAERHLL